MKKILALGERERERERERYLKSTVAYGCSFVTKLSWKKKVLKKNVYVFYKIYIICRKKCFYMEKKKFTEKNINENVRKIYLISEIYFYTENVCVTNKI